MRASFDITVDIQDMDFRVITRVLRRIRQRHVLFLCRGKTVLAQNDGFTARLVDAESGVVEFSRDRQKFTLTLDKSAKIRAVRYPSVETFVIIPFMDGINVKVTVEGNPHLIVH